MLLTDFAFARRKRVLRGRELKQRRRVGQPTRERRRRRRRRRGFVSVVAVMRNVAAETSEVGHELSSDVAGGVTLPVLRDAAVDAVVFLHVVDAVVVVVAAAEVASGAARAERAVGLALQVVVDVREHRRQVHRVVRLSGFLHLLHEVEHLKDGMK